MTAVALIMGRAGSQGVPGKNIRPISGKPLVAYPIEAALAASSVNIVYVSTDCPEIIRVARGYGLGVKIIERPSDLAQSDSEMSDVILHADEHVQPDIWVTMHANCGIHAPGLIDECVDTLKADEALDSCVSGRYVWDMHPYRLKKVNAAGELEPWVEMPADISNNRQAIREPAVVLDGACRAFRRRCLDMQGQPPFRYLGNRMAWVENPGGLDVHSEADLIATEQWLRAQTKTVQFPETDYDPLEHWRSGYVE
jgi:CMP-N-acetylneuraminic acid synthetase